MIAVCIVIFIFSYIFYAFWNHLAENISLRLRKVYLQALLRQEIGYFEKTRIEEMYVKEGKEKTVTLYQTILDPRYRKATLIGVTLSAFQ